MQSSKSLVLFLMSISTASNVLVTAAPLCPETVAMAGGGLPDITLPSTITAGGIKEIQLAQFLENLEVSYFRLGAANITKWGVSGYPNNSVEIVQRIAAVNELSPSTSRRLD